MDHKISVLQRINNKSSHQLKANNRNFMKLQDNFKHTCNLCCA